MALKVRDYGTHTAVLNRLCQSKGADIASATTITLGNDGNYFDVTGTTAIAYITTTNWAIGSQIQLQFDGIVILTVGGGSPAATSAPLLINAFTTAAGDTLWLVYDGTNWREVSRTVMS